MLDLKRLENMGKTAVRCSSEEQASMFMEAMFEQYPKLVDGVWRKGQTNWGRYRDIGMIYYLPRIYRGPGEIDYCQSTILRGRERAEYEVVEFEELLCAEDFGEFSADVTAIKILFDMG